MVHHVVLIVSELAEIVVLLVIMMDSLGWLLPHGIFNYLPAKFREHFCTVFIYILLNIIISRHPI